MGRMRRTSPRRRRRKRRGGSSRESLRCVGGCAVGLTFRVSRSESESEEPARPISGPAATTTGRPASTVDPKAVAASIEAHVACRGSPNELGCVSRLHLDRSGRDTAPSASEATISSVVREHTAQSYRQSERCDFSAGDDGEASQRTAGSMGCWRRARQPAEPILQGQACAPARACACPSHRRGRRRRLLPSPLRGSSNRRNRGYPSKWSLDLPACPSGVGDEEFDGVYGFSSLHGTPSRFTCRRGRLVSFDRGSRRACTAACCQCSRWRRERREWGEQHRRFLVRRIAAARGRADGHGQSI